MTPRRVLLMLADQVTFRSPPIRHERVTDLLIQETLPIARFSPLHERLKHRLGTLAHCRGFCRLNANDTVCETLVETAEIVHKTSMDYLCPAGCDGRLPLFINDCRTGLVPSLSISSSQLSFYHCCQNPEMIIRIWVITLSLIKT
jgi:hypothetical protein